MISKSPSKILAIKLRSLGDTVLLTAPLAELTRIFPDAEIHALVPEIWAPVLESFPGLSRVWRYQPPKSKVKRAWALAKLAAQLRKENYDCVLSFHASTSSSALALATGAKTRSIHFHGHQCKNRFSTVEISGKGVLKPIIERDMDTVRALGVEISSGILPQVVLTQSEKDQAELLLKQWGLKAPVLGLNLGASRPTKQWPVEKFVELAISWVLEKKGSVLAFTGPTELELALQFQTAVNQLLREKEYRSQIRSVDSMELRPLSAMLSQLSVLAGNDSGPKHLAVAVNTPTVTFFGPEHPYEWHPYPTDRHPYLFIDHLNCRQDADPGKPPWCGLNRCEVQDHQCMKRIEIQSALRECQRVGRFI